MATYQKNHTHIWKYIGDTGVRVCEAPYPFVPSCGRIEWKNDKGDWVEEKYIDDAEEDAKAESNDDN